MSSTAGEQSDRQGALTNAPVPFLTEASAARRRGEFLRKVGRASDLGESAVCASTSRGAATDLIGRLFAMDASTSRGAAPY